MTDSEDPHLTISQDIYTHIKNATNSDIAIKDYNPPPYVPKFFWTTLGDSLAIKEKTNIKDSVPNDKVYTLRLDIKNMSKKKKMFIRQKLFTDKYSHEFADIMNKTAVKLGNEFNATWVYTQSDEITMIIVPPTQEDSPNYTHMYGGKHNKLVSLSAALASTTATLELIKLALFSETDTDLDDHPTVEFDCRLAIHDNVQDAFSLILWRSYDCGINGVSDAVHGIKKSLSDLNTHDKLTYLSENNHLPLPDHQAYGSVYERQQVTKLCINPKTNEEVEVQRKMLVKLDAGSVVSKVKDGDISFTY